MRTPSDLTRYFSLVTIALLMSCLRLPSFADSVLIDDFRTVDAWSVNRDGGAIEISGDTVNTENGSPSMRLRFAHQGFEYGNAARAIELPPSACGIEFDLYVNYADSPASLFLWLFEKDGDGYLASVNVYGMPIHKLSKGRHRAFVPISAFSYQPRGNGIPQLLTANKLLVGMNNARADISIADLTFRLKRSAGTMPESRTQNLTIQDGPKGRVAILSDNFEPKPGYADPKILADALKSHGYGVTLLKAGDMADSSILSTTNFDCLILPYGPCYPLAASEAIKLDLKSGGSFLSTGGYAFDTPCLPDESGRLIPVESSEELTAEDVAAGKLAGGLNTRRGKPGDTLTLEPDQIGVFDPCYRLNHAASMRSAQMQSVVPDLAKDKLDLRGYAACSMLGSNSPVFPEKWGRHVPLVSAYDSLGRFVGGVGSIAHNYAGPYAKSSWAFFGVTNGDLFAKDGALLPYLSRIMDALVTKTYLHSLSTNLACYRNGETVRLSCKVADYGKYDLTADVRFRVYDRAGKQVFASRSLEVFPEAGKSDTASSVFRPLRFASDLYRVVAELSVDDEVIDTLETGFAAYDPKVTAAGLNLKLKDNYFRDGDRPVLLSGTNVTGAILYSGNENPLVWDRDLARMQENGVNILRLLHFSPFLSGQPSAGAVKPLDLAVDKLPVATERKLDALVQLCQKHKVILFLSIHDWMPVELTDKELAAQKKYARLIAARYKNAAGFMIDIQNEPHSSIPVEPAKDQSPDILREWNSFLRAKYVTDDALKAAWSISPPEALLGSIPWRKGTDAWDDARTLDADAFRNLLVNRWIDANRSGAKDGDPDVPVTVGFLQEYWALNKLLCMDKLDFANMHSYTGIDVLRADLKLFDRRFDGKSLSLGEFGSIQDHQKRVDGVDSDTQDFNRFLLTGHYLFGEGGSFIANWSWKDMDDVIFPWGINYQNGGPRKDILKVYRNQSLLFRRVKPVYEPPEVFLVVPVSQMLGGQSGKSLGVLYRSVQDLLSKKVDFGTIDDRHLSELPSSARILIYPIPFAIPDDAYAALKSFVERGGILCVTGDVSYDAARRRTRPERLEELCGVRFVRENYPSVGWTDASSPCIEVKPVSAEIADGIYVNKLGSGEVHYTPAPGGRAGDVSVLDAPFEDSGDILASGGCHVFRIPESDGSETYVLVNPGSDPDTAQILKTGDSITLTANGVGLARYDSAGSFLAVECQGPVTLRNGRTMEMSGHFAVISCDGRDISSSSELIVLPFGEGELDLSALGGDFVVQTGDVLGGKWRVLSESRDTMIVARGETAFDIRILAPKDRLVDLSARVADEIMLVK
jgi:hypothetical protein